MKEKLLYFYALVAIIIVTFFLQYKQIEPFESFSLRFNDINFDLQKKEINKDIVFVAVDEASVNKFGRWPWNREIIAKGIETLNQADVVLFDMIFSEPTNKIADAEIAESIANLKSSVCGFFLRHNSTQVADEEVLDILDDSALDLLQSEISQHSTPLFISAPYAELNILPIMQSCTLSGNFSTLQSSDKLLRSYPIAVYYQNRLFPSLGVQALRLKFDSDINRNSADSLKLNKSIIKLNKQGFVRLNFYDKDQYNIISFLDLIEKRVNPTYFNNKIVLFGITEIGAGDVVSTPVGAMYGPLLHYTFLSNFLENHLISEPHYVKYILTLLMVFVPFIFIIFLQKTLNRTLLSLSFYILSYIFIRYLFVTQMIYIDLFYPLLAMILSILSFELIAFSKQEKSTKFIKDAFSAYLSPDLLAQLIQNPKTLSLGGEEKELTILFSDIRGFTTISEKLDATSLVTLLNRYFTPMTNSILEHNGMLDKYIGDAVMAFYNAPVNVENHADQACLSALDMIDKLGRLNDKLKNDDTFENIYPLAIGIGINSANVVVGNIGSDDRFNYTAMGDGVNLSSRVEGLTKNYAVNILITEFTVEKLTANFVYRKIEPVAVKGKKEAILLYELMPNIALSKEIKKLYDVALSTYINGDLEKAKKLFSDLVKKYDDNLSKYFLRDIEASRVWSTREMTTK